ncbi:endoplasmic oxidoreductin-1 [Penicillium manginii]|uniref:endoplasmic oxidoreductin-1 n=1 Tax=Penicillium manginii TaxID=203109 RepID=UPI0025495B13|nr:endoplasmic oxidoreductin-1 [Penicillium manginii]KAJ5762980.1 endoplasmic oxidoreductin-1 [Penicillium manginii]
MVRDTTLFVLRSWMALPRTLLQIGVMEAQRLWYFWLGVAVPPREWSLQAPQDPNIVSRPHQQEL